MEYFEYAEEVTTLKGNELIQWLNAAGADGWELVAATAVTTTFVLPKTSYLFKRKIRKARAIETANEIKNTKTKKQL